MHTYVSGNELYRLVQGNLDTVKVIKKEDVKAVLDEFHGSAFGGHSGINKTTEAIKARYWWFGMTDDVKEYVRYNYYYLLEFFLNPSYYIG